MSTETVKRCNRCNRQWREDKLICPRKKCGCREFRIVVKGGK